MLWQPITRLKKVSYPKTNLVSVRLLPVKAFDPPHEFDCGPLCDYNRKNDGYYSYYQLTSYPQEGFTTYMLNMTSQKWMDSKFKYTICKLTLFGNPSA